MDKKKHRDKVNKVRLSNFRKLGSGQPTEDAEGHPTEEEYLADVVKYGTVPMFTSVKDLLTSQAGPFDMQGDHVNRCVHA